MIRSELARRLFGTRVTTSIEWTFFGGGSPELSWWDARASGPTYKGPLEVWRKPVPVAFAD